jgi:hypothetical protein
MLIRTLYLTLILTLLFGFLSIHAQETGYWKLEKIETKNKEESFGKLTRKLNGEAGNLVFSYENGNNNSRLVVKGNWETLPEILIPDEIVSLSADLKIEKFTPPTHHWSP